MTQVLTVPTHFGDLSELSEGLVDRVDDDRIILYGPTAYEEGAIVGFCVLLVDGTTALEGYGRVSASVDGGEERGPETRFDVVFDELQLGGTSSVVFERIMFARQSLMGEAPPEPGEAACAAEVPAQESFEDAGAEVFEAVDEAAVFEDVGADVAFDEAPAAFEQPPALGGDPQAQEQPPALDEAGAFEAPPALEAAEPASFEQSVSFDEAVAAEAEPFEADPSQAVGEQPFAEVEVGAEAVFEEVGTEAVFEDAVDDGDFAADSTMVASVEQLEDLSAVPAAAPAPELPQAPSGFAIATPAEGQILTRPTFAASWTPVPTERSGMQPSGYFAYGNELPIPAQPPRPELEASQRVSPAPRPGNEAPMPVFEARDGAPSAVATHEAGTPEEAPAEAAFEDVVPESVGSDAAGMEAAGSEAAFEDVGSEAVFEDVGGDAAGIEAVFEDVGSEDVGGEAVFEDVSGDAAGIEAAGIEASFEDVGSEAVFEDVGSETAFEDAGSETAFEDAAVEAAPPALPGNDEVAFDVSADEADFESLPPVDGIHDEPTRAVEQSEIPLEFDEAP